jgi:hypothetical protein
MTAQPAALCPSPGPALLKARTVRSWECRAPEYDVLTAVVGRAS